jgi:hypothetical protein
VKLPACDDTQTSYRYIKIHNNSEISALLELNFQADAPITATPTKVCVGPNAFQMFKLIAEDESTVPSTEKATRESRISCSVNGVSSQSQVRSRYPNILSFGVNFAHRLVVLSQIFTLVHTRKKPSLLVLPSRKIEMRPALAGSSCEQIVALKNVSDIPIKFKWSMPLEVSNELKFSPFEGEILPHHVFHTILRYSPMMEGENNFKAFVSYTSLTLNSSESESLLQNKEHMTIVEIKTVAQGGKIIAKELQVNIDKVLIMTPFVTQNDEIILVNPTPCDAAYQLRILERVKNDTWGSSRISIVTR